VCRNEFSFVDGDWSLYRRYDYVYDSQGRLSEIIGFLNAGAGHFEEVWKQTITRDAMGHVIRDKRDDYNGDCWDGYYLDVFEYDINGRLSTWTSSVHPLGQPPYGAFRYVYTYDGSGRVLWETYCSETAGTWSENRRFAYVYDPSGTLISVVDATSNAGTWVPTYMDEYAHDSSGRILSHTKHQRAGGTWVPSSRLVYLWDDSGRIETVTNEACSFGTWRETDKWEYQAVDTPSGAFFPTDHLPAARPLRWNDWVHYGCELNRYAGN
jgi:hypothetical protein